MKVINVISSTIKNTYLAISWVTAAFGGLCILFIAVSFSAYFLDYLLILANIPPVFASLTGRGILALIWLIATFKWWKHHKKKILRISQLTPEQRREYEENRLKRKKASEARSNKIALLLIIGFILYFIGKSNLGHALIGMLLNIIDKTLNYKTLLWILAVYVFYAVIQALNQISHNIYHGITEIKEKLDIIINQTD